MPVEKPHATASRLWMHAHESHFTACTSGPAIKFVGACIRAAITHWSVPSAADVPLSCLNHYKRHTWSVLSGKFLNRQLILVNNRLETLGIFGFVTIAYEIAHMYCIWNCPYVRTCTYVHTTYNISSCIVYNNIYMFIVVDVHSSTCIVRTCTCI